MSGWSHPNFNKNRVEIHVLLGDSCFHSLFSILHYSTTSHIVFVIRIDLTPIFYLVYRGTTVRYSDDLDLGSNLTSFDTFKVKFLRLYNVRHLTINFSDELFE